MKQQIRWGQQRRVGDFSSWGTDSRREDLGLIKSSLPVSARKGGKHRASDSCVGRRKSSKTETMGGQKAGFSQIRGRLAQGTQEANLGKRGRSELCVAGRNSMKSTATNLQTVLGQWGRVVRDPLAESSSSHLPKPMKHLYRNWKWGWLRLAWV